MRFWVTSAGIGETLGFTEGETLGVTVAVGLGVTRAEGDALAGFADLVAVSSLTLVAITFGVGLGLLLTATVLPLLVEVDVAPPRPVERDTVAAGGLLQVELVTFSGLRH